MLNTPEQRDCGVTRRGFLVGGALAGVASVLASTSAFAEDFTSTASTSESGVVIGQVLAPDSTEDADIVVVGSGIGGFFASMIAKEQGPDLKVVMLEKNGNLGGSTNFAECNGPATNDEDAAARLAGFQKAGDSLYVSNSMLHYERLKEQGDNADWLFGLHGVKYYYDGPSFYEGGNGASCIATLSPIAEDEGVDIRVNSRAMALVTSDPYTVTGVQYQADDGSVVELDAKAVILATGGMSTNMKLLGQYSSQDTCKLIGWGEGQDGDGQLLAEQTAHGRANHVTVDSMFNNVGYDGDHFAYDSPLAGCVAMQYDDCLVNEYGIRFADESGAGSLGLSDGAKLIESQGYVFSICDSAAIQKWSTEGTKRVFSGFSGAWVGQPLDLASELDKYADKPYVLKADSIDELGKSIAKICTTFDVDAFASEIDKYNGYASSGVDADYAKAADYLWPISEVPFYAFQVSSGMLNTSGGIRVNRDAQVTDARGIPIVGLYAAGVCMSGWDGEVYGGGTCQSVGMWGGSKAARHILSTTFGITPADNWMGDVRSTDTSPTSGTPMVMGSGSGSTVGSDASSAS